MNTRPPPDPRAGRIRDLIFALLDESSSAYRTSAEWSSPPPPSRAGELPPPSRRGEESPPPSKRGGDAGPASRRGRELVPPSRRSLELPAPRRTPVPSAPPSGDELDQALAVLDTLSREVAMLRGSVAEANRRLHELMDVIVALVSFDYEKKASVSDKNDLFDGMASGLNMLGEELSVTTVSKAHIDNIIESMSDLLIVTDKAARIRTVNQAACDLSGLSREELI